MGRSKLTVEISDGNLGRRQPNADMVSALVMNGVATVDYVIGDIVELRSVKDAEYIGLDAAYDTTNKVLVFHHISRFFLRNPSGILHIMLVAQDVTLTQMVDVQNNYVAKVLRENAGAIVQWAVARNPDATYVPTLVSGLDGDVITAIDKAQELIDFEFDRFRYSDCFIEGRSLNGTAVAALDLRTKNAPGVSVVVGADRAISESDTLFNGYAAVGDVLGLTSVAAVSQNIGELSPEFNLTNEANKAFITAGLSSNIGLSDYSETDLDALHDKGYIFADTNPGEVGFWLNDSHTCTALTSDYAYKENNRTIKKAIKEARRVLQPRIKRRIYVNSETGKIAATDAKDIETMTKGAIKPMLNDGDISGGIDAYVDPDQNILETSRLELELTFVPVAIGRQIKLLIGFKNPLK